MREGSGGEILRPFVTSTRTAASRALAAGRRRASKARLRLPLDLSSPPPRLRRSLPSRISAPQPDAMNSKPRLPSEDERLQTPDEPPRGRSAAYRGPRDKWRCCKNSRLKRGQESASLQMKDFQSQTATLLWGGGGGGLAHFRSLKFSQAELGRAPQRRPPASRRWRRWGRGREGGALHLSSD